MHIFEVLHHLIKEYGVIKCFLTVEGRAFEKKSIVSLFIKPLCGRVPPKREQEIYSQEITFSKNKGGKYSCYL